MSTTDAGDRATRLGKLFEAFRQNITYKDWEQTFEENTRLKKDLSDLKAAHSLHARMLTEVENDRDKAQQNAREKSAKLEEKTKEHTTLRSERDKAKGELEVVKRKLSGVEDDLEKLQGFAVQLNPISEEMETKLRDLFIKARAFAEDYFGADFTDKVLEDTKLWATMRSGEVPIPLTNSLPAKKMRVARVLSIISEELSNYIFQPVYLEPAGEGLSDHLRVLAKVDEDQESYLRSVLLKGVAADEVRHTMHRCIDAASESLLAALGPLFPKEKQESLARDIHGICNHACYSWRSIQYAANKIEPDFEYDNHQDWATVPFALDRTARDQKAQQNSNSSVNGGNAANSGKTKQHPQPQKSPQQQPHSNGERLDNNKSGFVVWPSFIIVSSDDEDQMPQVLLPGYVLDLPSYQAAFDEKTSLARKSLTSSASTRQRTKSFLGQRGGNGSKVG